MPRQEINKEILALAIPSIISNITTPLLGLVDTAITGHLGSAAYIGAIAVGGSMFSMAYWLVNFLRMGTSGLASQAYGAGRDTTIVLWRSLSLAAAISLMLMVLSPLIADLLLWFMDAEASISGLARTYFMIVIFGAPAVLASYSLAGWFLGMQDSQSPMWMAIATNVANIAISLVLVFGGGMRIEGVAIGTLSSQWIGAALGLVLLARKHRFFSNGAPRLAVLFNGAELRRFFSVNLYIFLRTLCLVAVTLWFTRQGARQGADLLAANALLMQLFILFSYFMDGFAFAGEAMAGKYQGMGSASGIRDTIRGVFRWGVVVAALFTIVYALGGEWVLTILTDDYGVVETASRYLPWAIAVPLAGVAAFVWDGIYIGMTLTRGMLASIAVATAAFFAINAICPGMGNHGLWLAFVSYLVLRGAVQTVLFYFPFSPIKVCKKG